MQRRERSAASEPEDAAGPDGAAERATAPDPEDAAELSEPAGEPVAEPDAAPGGEPDGEPGAEPAGTRPRRPGRYARLKVSIGRHPADVVRMAIAAGVVIACMFAAGAARDDALEVTIFNELQRLPDWTERIWRVITWFGWWPGIVAGAGLALYLGRVRMAAAVAWSSALAWGLAVIMHTVLGPRPVPPELLLGPHAPNLAGLAFPSAHVAVIAALATAAGPYVTRVERDTSWVLVVLVAVADMYLGINLALGVLAGGFLGWGVGTLLHVVLGAPGRSAAEPAVLMALRQAGIEPVRITPQRRRMWQPERFEVVAADGGPLEMKIVRRMHRLAGPGYKARRMLASVEVENEPGLSTPRHEVEHEAYITLLAERAGVGTLPVLLAGEIEHGPPFLIRRKIDGRSLADMSDGEVGEALLDDVWRDVCALGTARIAHHDLRAVNIMVDADGRTRITDFTFSRAGGPLGQNAQDVAEALVSVASVVGPERAVASAGRTVAPQTLKDALPHLQTLALHRRFRSQLDRASLTEVRERLAEELGCAVPPFRSPVRPATVAIMLAGGLAVYLLLPEISSINQVREVIAGANRWWLGATFACGMLAIIASSWTILGASQEPLPVGRTVAVQIASAFTGRTTVAALGYYAINLSFLERLGVKRTPAVGVLLLNRAATVVVTGIATIIGLLIIGGAVPVGRISIPWWVWAIAGGLLVAVVAFLATRFGRVRVWRPTIATMRQLGAAVLPTLRRPIRAVQLLGGEIAFLAFSAVGLATTLQAFGSHFELIPVLAVFVVASTVGQILPTPGGLGAVEGGLVAGLTAVGVHPADAIAAALAARVLTFWLPVLPGIVAFRLLQHKGVV